jgi:outer membrane protein assembly factor BamD (BamD/ComL family)
MKLPKHILLITLTLIIGCSKPTPDELFTKAQNSYQELQRAQGQAKAFRDSLGTIAIEQYSKVVAEYPHDTLAERAMFMVATIRQNDMQDFGKAIEAYKQYISVYPDSRQTPVAMFLVGYLYNNEFHNIDSASAAYRRFLEKFPKHEMALSAQFELNNLGKSPEELLPKPTVAEAPAKNKAGSKKK